MNDRCRKSGPNYNHKFERNDRAKSDPIYQIRYRAPYRDPSGRGAKHLHRGRGGGSYRFGRTRWSVACWLSVSGDHLSPRLSGVKIERGGGGRGARSRENDEGERGRLPDVVRVYDKLMVFRGGQPSSSTFGGRSHAKIQIVRPTVPLIIYGPSSLSLSLPPLFFQYVNIETAPTRAEKRTRFSSNASTNLNTKQQFDKQNSFSPSITRS